MKSCILTMLLLFAALSAHGEVTLIQSGDALTVVITQTFEKNGSQHLDNFRLFSKMWSVCGPEQAAGDKCTEYGALVRTKEVCSEALLEVGGCTKEQSGQQVEDARTLEQWLDAWFVNVLRSITKQGKTQWESQLLPRNESAPNDLKGDQP